MVACRAVIQKLVIGARFLFALSPQTQGAGPPFALVVRRVNLGIAVIGTSRFVSATSESQLSAIQPLF